MGNGRDGEREREMTTDFADYADWGGNGREWGMVDG